MAARGWHSALTAAVMLAAAAMPSVAAGAQHAHHAHASTQHSATAPSDPPTASPDDAYADPSKSLGATSPSCRYAVDARARRSCRASGSVAQPHPLSAYGLDVRVGFSLTDPGKSFMGALQSMAAALWMALLYVVKGVLLMLEWAFSLDLTNEAMPAARRTLARLHDQAFGNEWLLLALSIAGLWGMWRGLVQRRTTETLTGLAATVGLIVGALVVIAQPAQTVGRAAQITNDAGTAILAAATGARADDPRSGLTNALRQVFQGTVRDPWCALEFGSVEFCDQRTGDPARPTNAEVWLSYPAQGWERGRLHALMQDDHGGFDPIGSARDLLGRGGGLNPIGPAGALLGRVPVNPISAAGDLLGVGSKRDLPENIKKLVKKAPDRARMQEAGGTFPRLALLAIIAIGVCGAMVIYGYLGVRLLLAAGLTLVYLLIAPAMLLAPALGDAGRTTFIAWAKGLLGAVVAKLIYAVFLAVVLAASAAFAAVGAGWFGTWLLQAAFWWGIFVKRHELVGFVSAGVHHSGGHGTSQALATGYHAWMLGRAARQVAGTAATPATAGVAAVRARRSDGTAARTAATSAMARDQLADRHRQVLVADQQQARQTVGQRDELRHELRAVDRRLQGYDETLAAANATGGKPPKATAEQQKLLERRDRLRGLLADPRASHAEQLVRHADRNMALTGEPVTRKDLDVFAARRLTDLRDRPPGQPAQPTDLDLRLAGIDPKHYHAADDQQRQELRARVDHSLEAEHDLAHAAAPPDGAEPAPHHLEAARRWLDSDELRRRTAQEHAARRAERRRRRTQQGTPRVR